MASILLFSSSWEDEPPSSLHELEALNITTPDACFQLNM
uniref:Uncharacterized protein n=1 Tax=Arundo donax TaxID=35708 RepID=A0A0A9CEP8_ARUDO